MPDIAMCINEFCELKDTCYRYKANPAEFWQPYGDFHPKNGKCDHYWHDTRTEREVRNKKPLMTVR